MRVIAGKAKGRKLRSVPGPGTRPITDRGKSALFSIFAEDVQGAQFLDLFAGTGQVGIEALSRGADHAVFVELGHAALRVIRSNLTATELIDQAQIVRGDVFQYLAGTPQPFDYIYIAPPQYRGLWIQTLQVIDRFPQWLAEDGWAVVQINPVEDEPVVLKNLVRFDQRRYGGVMICFYMLRATYDDVVAEDTPT